MRNKAVSLCVVLCFLSSSAFAAKTSEPLWGDVVAEFNKNLPSDNQIVMPVKESNLYTDFYKIDWLKNPEESQKQLLQLAGKTYQSCSEIGNSSATAKMTGLLDINKALTDKLEKEKSEKDLFSLSKLFLNLIKCDAPAIVRMVAMSCLQYPLESLKKIASTSSDEYKKIKNEVASLDYLKLRNDSLKSEGVGLIAISVGSADGPSQIDFSDKDIERVMSDFSVSTAKRKAAFEELKNRHQVTLAEFDPMISPYRLLKPSKLTDFNKAMLEIPAKMKQITKNEKATAKEISTAIFLAKYVELVKGLYDPSLDGKFKIKIKKLQGIL